MEKGKKIRLRDITDFIELIGGRWRAAILGSLCEGPKRFSELKAELKTVTPRVLIKELRYLEMNKMIYHEKSTVSKNSVVYGLTEHGKQLEPLIFQIHEWAIKHRATVLKGDN